MAKKSYTPNQVANVRNFIKIMGAATVVTAALTWKSSEGTAGDWALCFSLLLHGVCAYDKANNLANHLLDWINPDPHIDIAGAAQQLSE